MSSELGGTRAFITGGGTGIGRAGARALAAQGCLVAVTGRTQRTLDETVELVREAGGTAVAILCDVTDEESVAQAVAGAAGGDGRIDFAVNSAGVSGETISDRLPTTPTNSSTGCSTSTCAERSWR